MKITRHKHTINGLEWLIHFKVSLKNVISQSEWMSRSSVKQSFYLTCPFSLFNKNIKSVIAKTDLSSKNKWSLEAKILYLPVVMKWLCLQVRAVQQNLPRDPVVFFLWHATCIRPCHCSTGKKIGFHNNQGMSSFYSCRVQYSQIMLYFNFKNGI